MQRYASGDEKATRASPSGHFEADASQCHLLRKCHEIRKNVLMKVNFQRPFSQISAAFKSIWLSYKERRVDALALRADERRDKLRKASGRSKYPMIRRYLNGET
jgi:hypothetical protein